MLLRACSEIIDIIIDSNTIVDEEYIINKASNVEDIPLDMMWDNKKIHWIFVQYGSTATESGRHILHHHKVEPVLKTGV